MTRPIKVLLGALSVLLVTSLPGEKGGPIRPLANNYVVVAEAPYPETTALYSPTLIQLENGRIVAGYTYFPRDGRPRIQKIVTSDDAGKTWVERAELPSWSLQGRVFEAGDAIYYISPGRGLPISRSDDKGETWTTPVLLTERELIWQQTPANVWYTRGFVYLAFERLTRQIDAWGPSEKALVLMRAPLNEDLKDPENWTFSTELVFADVLPGVRENNPAINFFPIPFYEQSYPTRTRIAPRRSASPIGWVEPAVVQILDPNHYWFDPTGRTFHLLARASTGTTNFAALTKVVEDEDGSMKMKLETVPSGNQVLFLPVPGGQMRFHLLYDKESQLYWLLGSQATDSMTRPELLPDDRFGLAYNERHRLVLHFSRNLVDWVFAGVVAQTDNPRAARHYASMAIDGDDLIILSRSGDERARSAHDGNLITFHRVRSFRDLIY